jgi:hypothetical protein
MPLPSSRPPYAQATCLPSSTWSPNDVKPLEVMETIKDAWRSAAASPLLSPPSETATCNRYISIWRIFFSHVGVGQVLSSDLLHSSGLYVTPTPLPREINVSISLIRISEAKVTESGKDIHQGPNTKTDFTWQVIKTDRVYWAGWHSGDDLRLYCGGTRFECTVFLRLFVGFLILYKQTPWWYLGYATVTFFQILLNSLLINNPIIRQNIV